MILIDSNVFLIALRYPRDANAVENTRFLEHIKTSGKGVTSIFNLLEVLGILSFNLNRTQLEALHKLFPDRFGVTVLPNAELESLIPKWSVGRVFERIARKLSLGDAMILEHAETPSFRVDTLVSWDAPHFEGRTRLTLKTPAQFLSEVPNLTAEPRPPT